MNIARAVVGVGCAIAAVAVVLLAWTGDPDALTAEDARAAARRHLEEASVLVVRVRAPEADDHEGAAVWRVPVEVSGGEIQIYLARTDGAPVFLDDRAPNGVRLLTEGQFQRLRTVTYNPAHDRWVDRNVQLTAGAIVLVPVALAFAFVPIGTDRRSRS